MRSTRRKREELNKYHRGPRVRRIMSRYRVFLFYLMQKKNKNCASNLMFSVCQNQAKSPRRVMDGTFFSFFSLIKDFFFLDSIDSIDYNILQLSLSVWSLAGQWLQKPFFVHALLAVCRYRLRHVFFFLFNTFLTAPKWFRFEIPSRY